MKTDPVNRFVVAQITRHRQQKRITVAELAKGTGIPIGSLSCLLTGRYRCSLLNLFKILSQMRVGILDVWPGTYADIPASDFKAINLAVKKAEAGLERLVSIEDILQAVSRVYGVSPAKLASPSRERRLSQARAIAAHLVSEQPHLTLAKLSRTLQRDTSGLVHVARRMRERLTYDRQLAERLDAVRRLLA